MSRMNRSGAASRNARRNSDSAPALSPNSKRKLTKQDINAAVEKISKYDAAIDMDMDGKISWNEYIAARKAGLFTDDENVHDHYLARMHKIKEIVIYIGFMVFFFLQSLRDLDNSNIFYFGHNLQNQFTNVEMVQEHSPQFGKNFNDVGTVEEFFQFMYGPMTHTAFSPNTFDGDPEYAFSNGKSASLLGYGKLIGAVRISQLRSKGFDCNFHVSPALTYAHNFTCYGANSWFGFGAFNEESEFTEDYGEFLTPNGTNTSFRYDGIQGYTGAPIREDTVAFERGRYMSTFKTKKYNVYPSPAYQVMLPPTLERGEAQQIVQNLLTSKYVDLHTRAIFVDANVYSPMLDRICHCRMIGEITSAGGVMPTFDFQVVRLWERVSSVDNLYVGLTATVGCFYGYYIWELYKLFKKKGSSVLFEFLAISQILNITFFFTAVGCQAYAETMYPEFMDPASQEYFDVGPSVRFKGWAMCLQGVNVFLNWFKLISILGYSTTFALVNKTIQRSASSVGGFLLVFFIIFYGFSQAHTMVFQGRLEEFRSVGDSCFTLMRSLLGDFDFVKLQEANQYMGPLLFIVFVVLAVFVVLNMLIAIISDAYDVTRRELENEPSWDLLEDVKDFFVIKLLHGKFKHTLFLLTTIAPKMVAGWEDHSKIDGVKAHPNEAAVYPETIEEEAVILAAPPAGAFAGGASAVGGTMGGPASNQLVSNFDPAQQSREHEIELLREMSSMRVEQMEMRQVMALLTLEVQRSTAMFKTVLSAAASPSKKQVPGGATADSNRTREV